MIYEKLDLYSDFHKGAKGQKIKWRAAVLIEACERRPPRPHLRLRARYGRGARTYHISRVRKLTL